MVKRLFGLILASLVSIFMTNAQDLIFDDIIPSSGSEISSFDFVLKFDLSKIIDVNGPDDYGVGWAGSHNDKLPTKSKSIAIYKGAPEDGILVGRILNTNMYGGLSGFKTTSDVEFSLNGVIPEVGVTYTMVITNQFKVFTPQSGATPIKNSNFDCFATPLKYTFVGASPSAEKLTITNCSIESNSLLKELSEISYTFSQQVSVNDSDYVQITENGSTVAKSIGSQLSDDRHTVTYKFDKTFLWTTHSYLISLPSGAVCSSENTSIVNDPFNTPITGNKFTTFELMTSKPTPEQKTIFSTIEGIFDMPEGFEIYRDSQYSINLYAYLYANEVDEKNLVGKLNGTYVPSRNGILWTNTFSLAPETTYILHKDEGEFSALDINANVPSKDWYNGEVNIVLHTPSVEDAALPSFVYRNAINGDYEGKYTELSPGMEIDNLDKIELSLADLNYKYNGQSIGVSIYESAKLLIYDITDGQKILVKEASLNLYRKSPQNWEIEDYTAWGASLYLPLYEGRRYKLVIPAGSLTIGDKLYKNFITNEEWSLELVGTTPAEFELISCSLSDNQELSNLVCVKWRFKGRFERDSSKSINLSHLKLDKFTGTTGSTTNYCPTVINYYANETEIVAYLPMEWSGNSSEDYTNGYPFFNDNNDEYKIILPEGFLYYAGNPEFKNSEMAYNIIPVAKKSEMAEPEYVDVAVSFNNIVTTSQKGVKGQPFILMPLELGDHWKIVSVMHGDTELSYVEDYYSIPSLSENVHIAVNIGYDGPWATENELTGIWEISDKDIRIFKENDFIVVEGVSPSSQICVYNLAGMHINSTNVSEGNDRVKIFVPRESIYVVTVDGVASKIQM